MTDKSRLRFREIRSSNPHVEVLIGTLFHKSSHKSEFLVSSRARVSCIHLFFKENWARDVNRRRARLSQKSLFEHI